jgi:radical SAM protein with 4Fe4S-binding SPASM domain
MTDGVAGLVPPFFASARLNELTYYITSRCNFRCTHCFARRALNLPQDELTVDELRRMALGIAPLHRVNLSGGEPFARPDLGELLLVFSRDWRAATITLPTNGSYCERVLSTIHHFGQSAPRRLRLLFSLSRRGADFDAFSGTRDGFTHWEATVLQAREAATRYWNISVGVLSSFNDENQHEFSTLYDYVTERLAITDFSFGLVRRHHDYHPNLDLEAFHRFLRHYAATTKQHPLHVAYREQLWSRLLEYYEHPRFLTPCHSGRRRAVMSPNGDIYPCEILGYPQGERQHDWLIGNVREEGYDLRILLRSARAREVCQRIRCTRCHCDDACDIGPSLLRQPSFIVATLIGGLRRVLTRRGQRNESKTH